MGNKGKQWVTMGYTGKTCGKQERKFLAIVIFRARLNSPAQSTNLVEIEITAQVQLVLQSHEYP